MKPLMRLLPLILALTATSAYAVCKEDNVRSCDQNVENQRVVAHYKQPVVYCVYLNDKRGAPYTLCHNCNNRGCTKEYFFDNYCEHD